MPAERPVLTAIRAALRGATANTKCVTSSRSPDVLIADLAMPVEDGFLLIRCVRSDSAFGRQLPAIALSAFADARSEESARAAGFSAFLAKPASPEALLGLIGRLLNAPERRRRNRRE
jgi:CheY-like chemotaxis protein